MNKIKAIKAMVEGKKVRAAIWPEGMYLCLNADGDFIDEEGVLININNFQLDNSVVYRPPMKVGDLVNDRGVICMVAVDRATYPKFDASKHTRYVLVDITGMYRGTTNEYYERVKNWAGDPLD